MMKIRSYFLDLAQSFLTLNTKGLDTDYKKVNMMLLQLITDGLALLLQ
ncbi:hypothetical protein [Bacillus subtilis]|nr:hypothetical protein [Bacillus subtilis]